MEGHHFWEQQNEIQEVRFLVPKDKRKMEYPFSIPAVRECGEIKFSSPVTIFTGENGSGKSSLLKMILGFYKPTGGIIYINGIPVEAYDCKTFYKEICYISQEEMLLNESVEDYLRYAAHADLKPDNIEQMRRKVKLRPEIKKIEENGATLSGGEKKKLLMLKWLLNPSTSFVILDEIDAGLDDETKVVLLHL